MSYIAIFMLYKILKMLIISCLVFTIWLIVKIVWYDIFEKYFIINLIFTVIIPMTVIMYCIIYLFV